MEQKLASLSFLDIYTGCFVKIRTFLYVGFEIHHSLHIKTSNQLKIVLSCLQLMQTSYCDETDCQKVVSNHHWIHCKEELWNSYYYSFVLQGPFSYISHKGEREAKRGKIQHIQKIVIECSLRYWESRPSCYYIREKQKLSSLHIRQRGALYICGLVFFCQAKAVFTGPSMLGIVSSSQLRSLLPCIESSRRGGLASVCVFCGPSRLP